MKVVPVSIEDLNAAGDEGGWPYILPSPVTVISPTRISRRCTSCPPPPQSIGVHRETSSRRSSGSSPPRMSEPRVDAKQMEKTFSGRLVEPGEANWSSTILSRMLIDVAEDCRASPSMPSARCVRKRPLSEVRQPMEARMCVECGERMNSSLTIWPLNAEPSVNEVVTQHVRVPSGSVTHRFERQSGSSHARRCDVDDSDAS